MIRALSTRDIAMRRSSMRNLIQPYGFPRRGHNADPKNFQPSALCLDILRRRCVRAYGARSMPEERRANIEGNHQTLLLAAQILFSIDYVKCSIEYISKE